MRYDLREEYQVPCVNGVRAAYKRKKKAPLLVAPCGSGKTVMFSYIAENASAKGKRVMIMAHQKELCTQCGEKMISNGVDFGYISPKFTPDYRKLVQVGTIQSIVARMESRMVYYVPPAVRDYSNTIFGVDNVPELPIDSRQLYIPDLIIIDEAHRSLAPTYLKIINFYRQLNPDLLILGVTATPVRGDGKALGLLYDEIVMGPTVRKLIDLGYLVEPEMYGAEVHVDLTNVSIGEDGDYNQVELARVVNKGCITGDAVAHYTKICPGAPAVVFCVDVQHAINVAIDFRAAGYIFEHIDGQMKDTATAGDGEIGDNNRANVLNRLRSGRIQGVTSVNLVAEGFDAPMLICAILLRPTPSISLAIQMPSRVGRPYVNPDTGEVKKVCYILDHANISYTLAQGTDTHGFIDDDRFWTLEGAAPKKKKKKKKGDDDEVTVKMTQCPTCHRLHKAAPKCPSCGHTYKANARIIDVVEGELVRLTRKRELAATEVVELEQMAWDKGLPTDWAENIRIEWENRVDLSEK